MKSAEFWIEHGPELYPTSGDFIKAIQSDALLEGLNKAKKMIEDYPDTDTPISDYTEELVQMAKKVETRGPHGILD